MAFPSLESALSKVSNRYLLVVLAAKRARQLNRGATARVETKHKKPTSSALEEIAAAKVEFRVKEDQQLHSYSWVDKNAGTVRIPIDDAMRLMLERGILTSRPQDQSTSPSVADVFPSDSSSGRVFERRRE